MMYPLVRELAVDGIPVTVTCRVLKLARQPYYRWLTAPVGRRELDRAYLADAVFDAHADDPGVRLPAARRRGPTVRPDRLRPHGMADLPRPAVVERLRQETRSEREEAGPARA